MAEYVEDVCVSVELVQGLYRSWKGYAEKLEPEQRRLLHIATSLDEAVGRALMNGVDVVLTGNPGDGKTHLMMLLQETRPELAHVAWVRDATAVESDTPDWTPERYIYESWRQNRERGIPTCLAVNEGVLRDMLRQVGNDELAAEVRRQLDEGVYYEREPQPPRLGVVVFDLDKRSPLSPSFVRQVLANLTDERFYAECPSCPARYACPVPRNREMLARDQVQERVARILDLVGRSGFHATMRELQGLIAYAITGGKRCPDLMRETAIIGTRFYDLLFEGEGDLFSAMQRTFDPGSTTHPLIDDALWTGTYGGDGWETAYEGQQPPNSYDDNGSALRAMASAKRALYFLQPEGSTIEEFLPTADRNFYSLLTMAELRPRQSAQQVVRSINAFFSKNPSDRDLRIWTRHHFDVPPSRVYFSTRSLSARQLTLCLPKPARWQQEIGDYQPQHVLLLVMQEDKAVARLRIDREVFRGLRDAEEGQPFPLRRPELINALETFLAHAGAATEEDSEVIEAMIESFKTGRSYAFHVYPEDGRYGS